METLKVLVVDDEDGIRSGIIRILKNYSVHYPFMQDDIGFELIEAASGEEAIEIIDKTAIDIFLLDNKLPGIEGIEVLTYINNKNIDAAVMVITSYASLDLAVKATTMGAYNFVPKPFSPDELKAAMDGITKHLFLKRMTRKMNKEGKHLRFQFLSVLSHELKSPINAIEGYLELMKAKQLGENIEDYGQMINRSMERLKGMRSLIMDLLDLTRIESGQKLRRVEHINLIEVLDLSLNTFEPMAIQKNISIQKEIPEKVYVKSDRSETEIIFNNLISNAIKYNKTDGHIKIKIIENEEQVIISIHDTGIGMDKDDMEKLFQDFVRIRNEKTQNITGSGLGLSIVKKLVTACGGDIHASSEPDKGSTFTINFPKA